MHRLAYYVVCAWGFASVTVLGLWMVCGYQYWPSGEGTDIRFRSLLLTVFYFGGAMFFFVGILAGGVTIPPTKKEEPKQMPPQTVPLDLTTPQQAVKKPIPHLCRKCGKVSSTVFGGICFHCALQAVAEEGLLCSKCKKGNPIISGLCGECASAYIKEKGVVS